MVVYSMPCTVCGKIVLDFDARICGLANLENMNNVYVITNTHDMHTKYRICEGETGACWRMGGLNFAIRWNNNTLILLRFIRANTCSITYYTITLRKNSCQVS